MSTSKKKNDKTDEFKNCRVYLERIDGSLNTSDMKKKNNINSVDENKCNETQDAGPASERNGDKNIQITQKLDQAYNFTKNLYDRVKASGTHKIPKNTNIPKTFDSTIKTKKLLHSSQDSENVYLPISPDENIINNSIGLDINKHTKTQISGIKRDEFSNGRRKPDQYLQEVQKNDVACIEKNDKINNKSKEKHILSIMERKRRKLRMNYYSNTGAHLNNKVKGKKWLLNLGNNNKQEDQFSYGIMNMSSNNSNDNQEGCTKYDSCNSSFQDLFSSNTVIDLCDCENIPLLNRSGDSPELCIFHYLDSLKTDGSYKNHREFRTNNCNNLLETARDLLLEQHRKLSAFNMSMSIQIKQFEKCVNHLCSIDKTLQTFHALFRFYDKCEKSLKSFKDHIVDNFGDVIKEYGQYECAKKDNGNKIIENVCGNSYIDQNDTSCLQSTEYSINLKNRFEHFEEISYANLNYAEVEKDISSNEKLNQQFDDELDTEDIVVEINVNDLLEIQMVDTTNNSINEDTLLENEYYLQEQEIESHEKQDNALEIIHNVNENTDYQDNFTEHNECIPSFQIPSFETEALTKKVYHGINECQISEYEASMSESSMDDNCGEIVIPEKNIQNIMSEPDNSKEDFVLEFQPETDEPLVKVHQDISKHLKPHQRDGVQFMFDSCFESVYKTQKKSGQQGDDEGEGAGCILAHCMGLGKTLQAIALAHTLMQNKLCTVRTVLVVCPRSVALNWRDEINKWLAPFPESQSLVYDLPLSSTFTVPVERAKTLLQWHRTGGIMITSYMLYQSLLKYVDRNIYLNDGITHVYEKSLRNPGPDLVFFDEGHTLKNPRVNTYHMLNKMQTKRRIILTGTPLQNNLKEYYYMLFFVSPKVLGTYRDFLEHFLKPIQKGQYSDSTEQDIELMKKRSHVLHRLLENTVQRKDVTTLHEYLPPKYEYAVYLAPSTAQKTLYNRYIRKVTRIRQEDDQIKLSVAKFFNEYQILKLISAHPFALQDHRTLVEGSSEYAKLLKRLEQQSTITVAELDGGELSDSSETTDASHHKKEQGVPQTPAWWSGVISEDGLKSISCSSKFSYMFDLLQQCSHNGEKLLVFSTSINVLNTIEYFLKMITRATRTSHEGPHPIVGSYRGIWKHGKDYYRFDGKLEFEKRIEYCKRFNDMSNRRGRLFIVSSRAGGLGLNMVGANRVVLMDVSWNPTIDLQSIFRAYRLGQTQTCYVYRLIAAGFMEQKIYERCVAKQAIAHRVVDEHQVNRHYTVEDLEKLYGLYEEPTTKPLAKIPVEDKFLADFLRRSEYVHSYHEHDTLLKNQHCEELNPEEQRIAWEEYETERDLGRMKLVEFRTRSRYTIESEEDTDTSDGYSDDSTVEDCVTVPQEVPWYLRNNGALKSLEMQFKNQNKKPSQKRKLKKKSMKDVNRIHSLKKIKRSQKEDSIIVISD